MTCIGVVVAASYSCAQSILHAYTSWREHQKNSARTSSHNCTDEREGERERERARKRRRRRSKKRMSHLCLLRVRESSSFSLCLLTHNNNENNAHDDAAAVQRAPARPAPETLRPTSTPLRQQLSPPLFTTRPPPPRMPMAVNVRGQHHLKLDGGHVHYCFEDEGENLSRRGRIVVRLKPGTL